MKPQKSQKTLSFLKIALYLLSLTQANASPIKNLGGYMYQNIMQKYVCCWLFLTLLPNCGHSKILHTIKAKVGLLLCD